MRFIEDGPSIPDELLIARDEGRVVLFCGSGVSRAKAGLPDFFGLVQDVIHRLGVPRENIASKLLNEANELHERTHEPGLISADRLFGLLEREYSEEDICRVVTQALTPEPDADIFAHQILMDLAKTPNGRIRLVTTNFDRLFDKCSPRTECWRYPKFPSPSRHVDFDGIVYLHGCSKEDYSGPESDFYILSSARFGQAYLTHGWVSEFFKEIISRYVVVFIGYSADDPPVRYLLEGYNKDFNSNHAMYAFQAGDPEDVKGMWQQKGVMGIGYSDAESHKALWDTLYAWAERAKDINGWYQKVISRAVGGPEAVKPHERGQIAHVVSSQYGAKRFLEYGPPPAEWLCVFDPRKRYARPQQLETLDKNGRVFDPFSAYGLDFDDPPSRPGKSGYRSGDEIPEKAWSAFDFLNTDKAEADDNYGMPRFLGYGAASTPSLPPRLRYLGEWIAKVADQPAAIWWAAQQGGLHPDIRYWINRRFNSSGKEIDKGKIQSWRYLFENWEYEEHKIKAAFFDLQSAVKITGWDSSLLRKYIEFARPLLKIGRNLFRGSKPPSIDEDLTPFKTKAFDLEVVYPGEKYEIPVQQEWLPLVVRGLCRNLEHAAQLELEAGGYGLDHIDSLVPENERKPESHRHSHGIVGAVLYFAGLFRDLVAYDPEAAKNEFAAWPPDEQHVFGALRIWACNLDGLLKAEEAGEVLCNLDDDNFWDAFRQRDLLLAMVKWWNSFTDDIKIALEERLLAGRKEKGINKNDDEFMVRRSGVTLDRITWLSRNGLKFNFDLKAEQTSLRKDAPDWNPRFAASAASHHSSGVAARWVRTNTDYSELVKVPIPEILTKAVELSGRSTGEGVNYEPFSGLAHDLPMRALSSLTYAAKQGEYPERFWRKFLATDARNDDTPQIAVEIAKQLIQFPEGSLIEQLYSITGWMLDSSELLLNNHPSDFWALFEKIVVLVNAKPATGKSAVIRTRVKIDWAMEALNSPAGKLTQALFKDPSMDGIKTGAGLPRAWANRAESLLNLAGDPGNHAVVILAHNLNWIFSIDQEWCKSRLISILDSKDQDRVNACWCGFFWGARGLCIELGQIIYPHLISLIKRGEIIHKYQNEVIGALLLAGWGSLNEENGQRVISSDDMREALYHADPGMLRHLLWALRSWIDKEGDTETWLGRLDEFFENVWPRTLKAKEPEVTSRLCWLLILNEVVFVKAFDAILPLLANVTKMDTILHGLEKREDKLLAKFPKKIIAILHRILPHNVSEWPYGVGEILDSLAENYAGHGNDREYLEIRRRWDAR